MNLTSSLRALGGTAVRAVMRLGRRRFLANAKQCATVQQQTLQRILALNSDSDFSRLHGLGPHLTVSNFQTALPIADYESFRPAIDVMKAGDERALIGSRQRVLMYSLTSATTNQSKFIPITQAFLNDYRRGWQIWGIGPFDQHPKLNALHILQLGSHHDLFRTEANVPCGNISGLVTAIQNPLVRSLYALPGEVAQVRDPETKLYLAARLALMNPRIGMAMTANASTLVQLGRYIEDHATPLIREIADGRLKRIPSMTDGQQRRLLTLARPNRQRAVELDRAAMREGRLTPQFAWPALELIAVWLGGSAGYYAGQLQDLFGRLPLWDHGLSASEGRITIPLRSGTASGVLDIGSHFFEFVPESKNPLDQPKTLLAHELDIGQNYYVLMTTPSGLSRYHICDVVRCTGFEGTTPCLEFLHKGGLISNLTGEKLAESQVLAAMRQWQQFELAPVKQFTLSPVWGEPPFYRLHADLTGSSELRFTHRVDEFDQALQAQNCEYRDKRTSGRLGPVQFCQVTSHHFHQIAQTQQLRPGSSLEQYKHPCLSPDLHWSEKLLGNAQETLSFPTPSLRKAA